MARSTATAVNAGLLVLCGAVNALLSKIVYQLQGTDCGGATKPFEKPWLQTALMFVAMAACLPVAWAVEAWQARASAARDMQRRRISGKSYHALPAEQQQQQQRQQQPSGRDNAEAVSSDSMHAAVERVEEGLGSHSGDELRQPLLPQLQQQQQHNSASSGGNGMSAWREALLLCVPTGFDLAATTLMNLGLLYVAASVFQVMRGAEMLFAALFAVTLLKRHLNKWHWSGVGLCMVGLCLVGTSRVLAGKSGDGGGADSLGQVLLQPSAGMAASAVPRLQAAAADPKQALLGMLLILLSQAIQAGQVTVEDLLMSDMDMHPLKVVGWEGVIGSAVMLGGFLPLLQHSPFDERSGLAEDTAASWCMVRNNGIIAGVLLISSLAVLIYNIAGMFVTESLGAATRTVLENARTLIVWLTALGLYYGHVGGDGSLGEPWDSWSWLQALGFAVFTAGAFLYDRGHHVEEAKTVAAGQAPKFSRWARLKATLPLHTGHYVGVRQFRIAGDAVLAGMRMARAAEENGRAGRGGHGGALEHA